MKSPPHDRRWVAQAACEGLAIVEGGYDTFFSDSGAARRRAREEYCAECPVRTPCLDYANAIGEYDYGTWGGMPAYGRRNFRKRRQVHKEAFEADVMPVVEAVTTEVVNAGSQGTLHRLS